MLKQSRCTKDRWQSGKKRSVLIIPMSRRSLNNLASLYNSAGSLYRCRAVYKRSLAILEKALGPDHPDVAAIAKQSSAMLYLSKVAMRKRSRYQAVVGDTGKSARSRSSRRRGIAEQSGVRLLAQGRYADAEPLFKRSLAIREKALGPNHPDVALSLNNLASLYKIKVAMPTPNR